MAFSYNNPVCVERNIKIPVLFVKQNLERILKSHKKPETMYTL